MTTNMDYDQPTFSQSHVFENMRLRRIVKENHSSEITQVGFFFNTKNFDAPISFASNKTFDKRGAVQRAESDTSNVLATVGGCQLNVYDNEHCGDHLDIMSNYDLGQLDPDNDENYYRRSHELVTFCWLYRFGDAYLVTAGGDAEIHVLSLAKSEEEQSLKGHTKPVLYLEAHPKNDNNIVSVSKDGTVRLWDIDKGKCLVIFECDATFATFDPLGEIIITGNARGEFRKWIIPTIEAEEPLTMPKSQSTLLRKFNGDNYIDSIRFTNNNSVLSKSSNGKVEYWNLDTEKTIRTFRVKTGESTSRFDVSLDNQYLAVGSTRGSIFIYHIESGELITELEHRRATKAIKCCAFSRDCRQMIAAGADGFIMRYDYVSDDVLKEWEEWKLRKNE
ncbi:WD40 repeat-like protein [Backusella circina FSU 941]|nr:WD40 repeat-like protein [Backusella circina FSU 941]